MAGQHPRARIGISGWRYAPWRGVFYPPGLPQRRELEYVGERLGSVELNGSFYSLQRPESYRRWHEQTPDDFVFALKGPRFITHMLRLRGVQTALANFFASGVLALGSKVGPVLWQLPERHAFDPEQLDEFLSLLPRTLGAAATMGAGHDSRLDGRSFLELESPLHAQPMRHALEVRSPSFVDSAEFVALLRRHRVALVTADAAGTWPMLHESTADFRYVRLHGDTELYASGYGDQALDSWADSVRSWARAGQDSYVYFDNDAKVHAPFDALALQRRLPELL